MSATGLELFDKTIQTTNIWLDEIMEQTGSDRRLAWKMLTSVLRTVRDRVPVELASHLGAQLPTIVRGAYYDQFEPSRQPAKWRSLEEFRGAVAERLSDVDADPGEAIRAVFGLMWRHVTDGQALKVWQALPDEVREAFEAAEPRRQPALEEA